MNKKLSVFNQRTVDNIKWKYNSAPAINQWTIIDIANDLIKVRKDFIKIICGITGLLLLLFICAFIALSHNFYLFIIVAIAVVVIIYIPLALSVYIMTYATTLFSYRFTEKRFEIVKWNNRYILIRKCTAWALTIIVIVLLLTIILKPQLIPLCIIGIIICALIYWQIFLSKLHPSIELNYDQYHASWHNFDLALIDRNRNIVFLRYKNDKKNHRQSAEECNHFIYCGIYLEDMIGMLHQQASYIKLQDNVNLMDTTAVLEYIYS